MNKLAISILSADFYKLGEEIDDAVKIGADWAHIDVMDSHFVPPLTFGSKIVTDIKKHNNIFCDVHLMVTNPDEHIMPFIKAGADLINFHSEAATHGDRIVSIIKENKKLAGITINPGTPINFIQHYLPIVDLVLVMSVNPGYAGQKFIEYNLAKIEELKKIREIEGYNYLIEIDGGVSLDNIDRIINAGTDVIVTASAFFNASYEKRRGLVSIIHGNKK